MQESAYPGNLKLIFKTAAIAAVVFVIDQYTKLIAFSTVAMADRELIPNVFGFTHHQNYGIIANLPVPVAVTITSTVLVCLIVVYALRQAILSKDLLRVVALSLILAGAFGNLYDRIAFGFVRDWILLFGRSVINVADIAIFTGIASLLVRKNR